MFVAYHSVQSVAPHVHYVGEGIRVTGARKRGLTTQERQLEIEARKKQAAESKMQKAAKKVQDLAAARELVNRMSLVPTA